MLVSTRTVPGRAAATTDAAIDSNASSSESEVSTMSTVGGKLGRGLRYGGAAGSQGFGLLAVPIVDDELIAGVEEALCERAAHVAESNQPHGRTRVLTCAHCSV